MIYLGLAIILFYALALFMLSNVWGKIEFNCSSQENVFVTVIIPVRNEQHTIVQMIKSVLANDYPDKKIQLIVVNDHSTDNTVQVLSKWVQKGIQVLDLPPGQEGKKAAIAYGVSKSNGQIVICTDGDSIVSPGWIAAHVSALEQGSQLSFGPVTYLEPKGWVALLNMELSALIVVGAATNHMGKPSLINGCNYSFKKETFLNVNGFNGSESIPSGDDEFLLRKVHARGFKVMFLKDNSALVQTTAPEGVKAFLNQRKRWASKYRYHQDRMSQTLPVLVFTFYLFLLISLGFTFHEYPMIALSMFMVKSVADYIFIYRYLSFFREKIPLIAFLLMQIIYPFYVIFFGLASNFGQFAWKGRKHRI